jgi:hypothetical protein
VPHVFTLEGLTSEQLAGLGTSPVVTYPPAGAAPLSPHGVNIGPARPATFVFGPGGTPVMYRRRYPARGSICDYCSEDSGRDVIVVDGGQHVIPPRDQFGSGEIVEFLRARHPLVAGAMVLGGSLLTGAVLGGLAVWLYRKAGGTPKRPAWEEW